MKRSSRESTQEKSRELAVKLEQRQLKRNRLEKKRVDNASREEAHEIAEVVPKALGSVPPVEALETVS